jgi:hypothetical protein
MDHHISDRIRREHQRDRVMKIERLAIAYGLPTERADVADRSRQQCCPLLLMCPPVAALSRLA